MKATKSADGVSQSRGLRLDRSMFEFGYLHKPHFHPNHSRSVSETPEILKYIKRDVVEGRLSGQFTWKKLKKEVRGKVIVCLLGAVNKAGEPRKLHIVCDLSFKGKASQ
jgi:hypothetical protein